MEQKNSRDNHEFALFYENIPVTEGRGKIFVLDDQELVHRIVHVLRLHSDEEVVLFSRNNWVRVKISHLDKRHVEVESIDIHQILPIKPDIVWYLPLLDREAFVASLSILASMGAREIIPIVTEKSSRKLSRPRDRMERIMVAAAEQSKQFSLPIIHEALLFEKSTLFAENDRVTRLFFDPQGAPAFDVMNRARNDILLSRVEKICCLVGPEGDLTDREKGSLREKGISFCALTESILRAEQAITVAMGLLRSLCRPDV